MPRHFSPADREYALERLIANRGDVALTAKELGITARTLYRWQKEADMSPVTLTTLTTFATHEDSNVGADPRIRPQLSGDIPTDDLAALRDLKAQMMSIAKTLADTIPDAIAEAPLGQRVSALAQLTDRIIKLAAQLPDDSKKGGKIRIVFVDEQGREHTTLPESDDDFEE